MYTSSPHRKYKAIRFLPAIMAVSVISLTSTHEEDAANTQTPHPHIADNNSGQPDIQATPVTGRYIVGYKDSEEALQTESASAFRPFQQQDQRLQSFRAYGYALKGFSAELTETQVQALLADSRIAFVEPDQELTLLSTESTTDNSFAANAAQTVSWGATRVGMGDGAATNRTAWIIDSGIQLNHPDLYVDVARSRSFIRSSNSPADEYGHGTQVAGIIGAKNNEFGVVGVAAGARLVSLRVMDAKGAGSVSAVISALNYVAANGRPGDVANLSLGSKPSEALDRAVLMVANKGIYVTIAAGNVSGNSADYSPARVNHPNVFTVSGMRKDNTFLGVSNWGEPVDYCAPGTGLMSTNINSGYGRVGGTSMASPHVAGLLLLKGKNLSIQGTVANDPDGMPDLIPAL